MLNIDENELRWKYFGGYPAASLLVLFGLVGVLFVGGGAVVLVSEMRYRSDGVDATARVTDKSTSVTRERHGKRSHYRVSYAFTDAGGHSFEGRGEVNHAAWELLVVGAPIAIRYLSSDPANNRLRDHNEWPIVVIAPLLGGAIFLVMALIGRSLWRKATHAMEIIRDGRPLIGQAGRIVKRRRGKSTIHELEYQFTARDGRVRTGKAELSQGRLRKRWEEGGPIVILVDADDLDCHRADIYEARIESARSLG
ncbi:MAG: DUF3592 domain-containing protein [Planctomycetota bacterium]